MAKIVCKALSKHYDSGPPVLHPLDLQIDDGEFVVLLGPSGCGKSTMLRMIAGLEGISGGELQIGEKIVNEVPARERNVAMVFQNYALYPHMSVYNNIAFGLRRLKVAETEIDERVREVASLLNLDALLDRKPRQMSGGQQQRAAIARAMIKTPSVFLFDEPLSNLDAKLRAQLRGDIKRLHRRLKTTTVYVTHDQLEAMTLADRVILMKGGHIEQAGTPSELYHSPRTLFAAGFIGTPAMNFISGVVERSSGASGGVFVRAAEQRWALTGRRFERLEHGQTVKLAIRPNYIRVVTRETDQDLRQIRGTVELVELLGAEALVTFDCAGERVAALIPSNAVPALNSTVMFEFREADLHVFDAQTEDNVALESDTQGRHAAASGVREAAALSS